MTWRELSQWRPRWWMALAARVSRVMSGDDDGEPSGPPHRRSSEERARFWAEFRSGQREADQRVLEKRKSLTPCPEDGSAK